jgi:mitochondrial fission protein ELM1
MEDPSRRYRILALSDGKPGHFHQTEGILMHLPECAGEMLRVEYSSKAADNVLRAKVLLYGRRFPKRAARSTLAAALSASSADALLEAEPADLVLSTGSSVAAPNLLLSRAHGSVAVVCSRPSPLGVRPFDAAILARHQWRFADGRTIRVLGAPTPVTPATVAARREALKACNCLPTGPTVGLLFGGNDRRYRWTVSAAQSVLDGLLAAAGSCGGAFAVVTSRRTPADVEAFIRTRVSENPLCCYTAFPTDSPAKEAPVLTLLALSDCVAVTVDSFSMVCEAASSGRPVALVEIPSRRHDRYQVAFRDIAAATGMLRMPPGTEQEIGSRMAHDAPSARPLRDAETAADGVRALLGASGP